MSTRSPWLRRELLMRLMLPLLAIVGAAGIFGTYGAQRLSDRVFDRWLLDAARSLAQQIRFEGGQVRLDLPAAAEAILRYDETDVVFVSVDQDSRHLFGQTGIPRQGSRQGTYRAGKTFDSVYDGRKVRVASVDVTGGAAGGVVTVLVAETTIKRDRAQRDVLMMMLPFGVLLVGAALAIGLGVRRTVLPLEALAARWNALSHASLEPISPEGMPRELVPFATALNGLLERIRNMLAREREFLSTVAHQLRTPLAGIRLGLARAVEASDLAGTRQVLQELDQSTERAARVVQQLLSLGRLDPEARRDVGFVSTELVTLSQEVGSAYLEFASNRRITFELREPPQPVWVTAQPDLLSEALGNLIDNALRYTPVHGHVQIDFGLSPPAVRVSDSGPGVPPDERQAVFERLVRGRQTSATGSGLGLSIVRDIASLHDASVAIEDSPLGGASFVIRFGVDSKRMR